MKRFGNLWPQIIDINNLVEAAHKAQRGKRYRPNVLAFNHQLEANLWQLHEELANQTYQPGSYFTFEIVEPKRRMISAAPYRDRVVHHALCNVIAPLFERTFTTDSFANRTGYGTHRAVRRFVDYARRHRYVLQCDLMKYFPSIDHAILKEQIRRKLKCAATLWLIDRILDGSNAQEPTAWYFPGDDLFTPTERRRGLPIGNLTSQFFANIYLNGFDHFIKEELGASCYVRYVDDFALFGDDKDWLAQARHALTEWLMRLRLRIHPIKSQLFETRHGASFLGYRVLPRQVRVRSANLQRARQRFASLQDEFQRNELSVNELSQSIRSWVGHVEHADSWRLREQVFSSLAFARV
jgi:retron-type reverse transcriptase